LVGLGVSLPAAQGEAATTSASPANVETCLMQFSGKPLTLAHAEVCAPGASVYSSGSPTVAVAGNIFIMARSSSSAIVNVVSHGIAPTGDDGSQAPTVACHAADWWYPSTFAFAGNYWFTFSADGYYEGCYSDFTSATIGGFTCIDCISSHYATSRWDSTYSLSHFGNNKAGAGGDGTVTWILPPEPPVTTSFSCRFYLTPTGGETTPGCG
jgi:hypothetical protein